MANDPQFRVQDDRFSGATAVAEPPKKRSALATCLTGCLIVAVVIAVLGIIAIVWISRNWRDWASSFGADALKQTIQQTDLPQEEVNDINVQIDRVAEAFRAGDLSAEQMGAFFENFVKSPLMTTIAMAMVDKKYIEPSGLSDEEKAEARVTVQRFMRGAIDQKISEADVDKAMEPVSTRKPDGGMELKDKVTDDELKAFLAAAKKDADAAEIPQQVEAVDPSEEFKRLVDETLGNAAAAPALENEAPAEEAAPEEEEGAPALN